MRSLTTPQPVGFCFSAAYSFDSNRETSQFGAAPPVQLQIYSFFLAVNVRDADERRRDDVRQWRLRRPIRPSLRSSPTPRTHIFQRLDIVLSPLIRELSLSLSLSCVFLVRLWPRQRGQVSISLRVLTLDARFLPQRHCFTAIVASMRVMPTLVRE